MKILLTPKIDMHSCRVVQLITPLDFSFACLNDFVVIKTMKKIYHQNVKVKIINQNIVEVEGHKFIQRWKLIDDEAWTPIWD